MNRIILLIISFSFFACTETEQVNSIEKKETISYEDSLYDIYLMLPAPNDVIKDLDGVFSDSLKYNIINSLGDKLFLEMSFSLRDSAIVDVFVFDINNSLRTSISNELIGHHPSYKFIDNYKSCDYKFLLDRRKFTFKKSID